MKTSPMLEEIMEMHGAQGSTADKFIKRSRVLYRRRLSKQKAGECDMVIGYGGMRIEYFRLHLGIMLKGYTVVCQRPDDPPVDIIRRTFHLSAIDELNVSEMKYDKRRRQHYIRVSAPRHSNAYIGGSRVYLRIPAAK